MRVVYFDLNKDTVYAQIHHQHQDGTLTVCPVEGIYKGMKIRIPAMAILQSMGKESSNGKT